MTTRLLLAPAGAGKTAYAVEEARRRARGLGTTPHVLVASALQAQAFRRRLANAGGAIGVRVLTFEELYRLCLGGTDVVHTEISDAVQRRVIGAVVRALPLHHFAPIADRPGFVHVLKTTIDDLKAARVDPASFRPAVDAHGAAPRLGELADIYASYQARLRAEEWVDPPGLGWLATQALEDGASPLSTDESLFVDGFDDFTSVQLALLASFSRRLDDTIITLTGTVDSDHRFLAHRRFDRTRRELEESLGVAGEPLPGMHPERAPVLRHLESGLFRNPVPTMDPEGAVYLIEAPDRAAETRAALRWLKSEIIERGCTPNQVALLARDVTPYQPFVRQVAAEFGLPVRVYAGEPLGQNPAVAALLDLLRLALPVDGSRREPTSEPALPPRLVTEAWRSPYFDWSAAPAADGEPEQPAELSIGIDPGDADALAAVARRGRVIEGLSQWEAAFQALQATEPQSPTSGDGDQEEEEPSPRVLNGSRVRELRQKFGRFVQRLTPPAGRHSARDFVAWLESLIGRDPEGASSRFAPPASPTSLDVIAQIRALGEASDDDETEPPASPVNVVERDLAALRCLKRVLRGLVWAEEALQDPPITFPAFLDELTRALEGARYDVPTHVDREEILVADVVAARGLPFRAVAVLGLAEGFFPATQTEDPLLWDADRQELELPLEPSTESAEAEYFYEAIAAPSERLLLSRPRLTDDGAPWQPSPFWEEVRRLVDVEPSRPSGTAPPRPRRAASWPELIQSASSAPRPADVHSWLVAQSPDLVASLDASAQVLTWRRNKADTPFDGGLDGLRDHFARHFDAHHTWSASRLEAYRTCPFYFFTSRVLDLEPREEPTEGVDWLQRGNLYHKILERVYRTVDDPTDLDELLGALPAVAGPTLNQAPEEQGFRQTAWWTHTRREIVDDLRRTLEALCDSELRGDFVPVAYEAVFGLWGAPPLVATDPEADDAFELRGLIDRVDRDADGRVRIIDYKTAGPSRYGNATLRHGEKIQLPLYALAARDALGLGQPASGFYWHVRHAEPSPFKLEDFGPDEAIRTAVGHAWEAIRSARRGRFAPNPPAGGCPAYCPAATFCWHYQRRWVDTRS